MILWRLGLCFLASFPTVPGIFDDTGAVGGLILTKPERLERRFIRDILASDRVSWAWYNHNLRAFGAIQIGSKATHSYVVAVIAN